MTPAARIAAAIGMLDASLAGEPVERALTGWARRARYAGSGDRAAIRDLVYDALRRRRSLAALGGADTGRGLMLGALRAANADPDAVFTGVGHAPAPLTTAEQAAGRAPAAGAEALDCPDWLWPAMQDSLGALAEPVLEALRHRAPVHLRANLARIGRDALAARLAGEGVEAVPHPLSPSALEVVSGARRLRGSAALGEGLAELQDAASQAVADLVPLAPGQRFLDYCAGGGGKVLAVAARVPRAAFFAHDAAPRRMADLPERAARAGADIGVLAPGAAQTASFDAVLVDAPCSGSGSWRRDPEGKWRLMPTRLDALTETQAEILDAAALRARPGGVLVHATCSLLDRENAAQVAGFLARHPGWRQERDLRLTPLDGGDGFFAAVLRAPA